MENALNFSIDLIQPSKRNIAVNFFQKVAIKKIKTQLNDYLNMNVIELSKVIILNYGYGINIIWCATMLNLDICLKQ